jgi:uncharacterized protein YbjT (DUF2867 family)
MRFLTVVLAILLLGGPASARDKVDGLDAPDRMILVIGATGQQGGAAARALLEHGYRVRGLTRSPNKPRALAMSELGVEMVKGDLDDLDSLDAALQGAYGVFVVTDFWEHGYDGEVRHGRNIADAAKAAGIGHLVYSSVASADRNTGIPHFDSKFEIENYIRESGLNFTIIRPVSFMQNWTGARPVIEAQGLQTPQRPNSKTYLISTRDIGRFAAEAFDDPDKWLDVELDIAGDAYTMLELADLFSQVVGKPVRYSQTDWDEYAKSNGDEMTLMVRWFDEVGYNVEVESLRAEYPWMTGFDDYLAESW